MWVVAVAAALALWWLTRPQEAAERDADWTMTADEEQRLQDIGYLK